MVNMFSGASMYGYSGMGNSFGASGSGNVPHYYKIKYGNGYEDFNTEPYVQPYPRAVLPRTNEVPNNFFTRLMRKIFYA